MADFIGYLQLYLQIIFEDEDSLFCKYQADFSKPITEAFMEKILKNTREFGEAQPNRKVKDVVYVTKEVYDIATADTEPDFVWAQNPDGSITQVPAEKTDKIFPDRLAVAAYFKELADYNKQGVLLAAKHTDANARLQTAFYYAIRALEEQAGCITGTVVYTKQRDGSYAYEKPESGT